MMLDLMDPLWEKLDSADRDQDVPKLLSELAEAWDRDKADSLFWDCLDHQGTSYGATYAAIPHLLKIAEPDENWRQRLEVGLFLGYVTLCTLGHPQGFSLPELPETLDGWERKLDCHRTLIARFEDPDEHSSVRAPGDGDHLFRLMTTTHSNR